MGSPSLPGRGPALHSEVFSSMLTPGAHLLRVAGDVHTGALPPLGEEGGGGDEGAAPLLACLPVACGPALCMKGTSSSV